MECWECGNYWKLEIVPIRFDAGMGKKGDFFLSNVTFTRMFSIVGGLWNQEKLGFCGMRKIIAWMSWMRWICWSRKGVNQWTHGWSGVVKIAGIIIMVRHFQVQNNMWMYFNIHPCLLGVVDSSFYCRPKIHQCVSIQFYAIFNCKKTSIHPFLTSPTHICVVWELEHNLADFCQAAAYTLDYLPANYKAYRQNNIALSLSHLWTI